VTPREQIETLKMAGHSNAEIARALGVCEGAVRYRLRRGAAEDRRKDKPRKAAAFAPAIEGWILANYPLAGLGDGSPAVHLRPLHEWLRREHGCQGCRRSLVRYAVRCCLMGGLVEDDVRDRLLALGAVAVLAKPFDFAALADTLREVLKGEGGGGGPRPGPARWADLPARPARQLAGVTGGKTVTAAGRPPASPASTYSMDARRFPDGAISPIRRMQ
jgi:DNA-binding NarL/FixJ family response regulator